MKQGVTDEPEVIRSDEVSTNEAIYKYSLRVSESPRVASYKLPLYSIAIEMTRADGLHTAAHTGEIFADAGRATAFYERMVEKLATPIGLPYIVEDEIMK